MGDATPLEQIARQSAPILLLDTEQWIHRRVERVQYAESDLLRWHFSVDFTITEKFPCFENRGNGSGIYYAPVALLRKWPPLLNLSVRDEAGRPIPLLTLDKNRRVDAEALIGLMPRADPAIAAILRSIVFASTVEDAKSKLDQLALGLLNRVLPSVQTAEEAESWRRVNVLATNFAWNSLLWVRVEGRDSHRQVVKVSFERLAPSKGTALRRLRANFGLAGEWLQLDLYNLGERGSYHLEFTPPLGTDVLDARLRLHDPLTPREPPVGKLDIRGHLGRRRRHRKRRETYSGAGKKRSFGRSTRALPETIPLPTERQAFSQNLISRAHFYVAESSGQRGTAYLRLGPTRREFLNGALYASVLTTALLWFTWAHAGNLAEAKHEGPTVTALLLLPALLSYLFTQPLPHPIARRMIAGVRLLTRLVTLLPVVAALSMLGLTEATGRSNPDIGLLERCWFSLAVAASVFTLVILVAAKLLPRAAVGETYAPY